MAAVPGIAPTVGTGPAQPSMCYYHDYYSDPQTDIFQGNYAAALDPYLIPLANQNVPTPVRVQDLAANYQAQDVPSAFLLIK